MKLCENTLSILKNFSGINPSLMFKEGDTLRTISPQKTVMAQAKITDNIEGNAAVYDLSRFLSTLSLFNDPTVEFGTESFMIKDGRRKVNYTYAAANMIVAPPASDIKVPSVEVQVDISWEDIDNVKKAAGVLQVSDVAFVGESGKIKLVATEMTNSTSDKYDVEIGEYEGEDFNMHIKVDNLKLIPADYEVSLSSQMAHFKSESVQYWIAVQSN